MRPIDDWRSCMYAYACYTNDVDLQWILVNRTNVRKLWNTPSPLLINYKAGLQNTHK